MCPLGADACGGVTTPGFAFDILTRATGDDAWPGRARLGQLTTPHGTIDTPAFIFCATKAAIKGVTPHQMADAGTQIILANTYHLMLRPGAETVTRLGGLHKMMAWDGPMLTDSGGFQIFSLGHGSVAEEIKGNRSGTRAPTLMQIDEDGAAFRSYLDGSPHTLTPESSIDIQRDLGADIILVLDECTPYHVERDYTARAMQRSHRWAQRSFTQFAKAETGSAGLQGLYGIVQGGVYPDLRQESAEQANFLRLRKVDARRLPAAFALRCGVDVIALGDVGRDRQRAGLAVGRRRERGVEVNPFAVGRRSE